MIKVFITGSPVGQLHWELLRSCPDGISISSDESLDITDTEAVKDAIAKAKPDVIINPAAYTAVDKAEEESKLAHAINAIGVVNLVAAAKPVNAHIVHISTDYVFGAGDGSPFKVDAPVAPVSVYGKTKLEGERVLTSAMPDSSVIVRTAWVYSSNGNNFVKTMLKLMSERDELGIISDQIGSPTWARSLAGALWSATLKRATGIHHWTGGGVASWYDFAVAIGEEAVTLGLLDKTISIKPLRTDQYPTNAVRPFYSVLDISRTSEALDLPVTHWRDDLRAMLKELE